MNIFSVSFPALLDVQYSNGLKWRILDDFACQLNLASNPPFSASVVVPAGFITDLASVPRVLWDLFPPEGKYTEAAAVHDYLYSIEGNASRNLQFSRADCDRIFLEAMHALGVSLFVRRTMWAAVRAFGGGHWGTERHTT